MLSRINLLPVWAKILCLSCLACGVIFIIVTLVALGRGSDFTELLFNLLLIAAFVGLAAAVASKAKPPASSRDGHNSGKRRGPLFF